MQNALQVTFRDMPPSEALEAIRDKAAKLEQFHPNITSCRVTVEEAHRHHQQGKHFGVKIELHEIGASARSLLKKTTTSADGRTDAPLIGGGPLRIGTYELSFHVGDYFAKTNAELAADRTGASDRAREEGRVVHCG